MSEISLERAEKVMDVVYRKWHDATEAGRGMKVKDSDPASVRDDQLYRMGMLSGKQEAYWMAFSLLSDLISGKPIE